METYATAMPRPEAFACPYPPDAYSEIISDKKAARAALHSLDVQPFDIRKGTWFDQSLDFREPEGDAITRHTLKLIAAFDRRKRRLKPIDESNRYTLVRKILANGFRCHFYRQPTRVAYSRRAGGYRTGQPWICGRAMARTVDLLVQARVLESVLGQWGDSSSAFYIKPKLYGIGQDCGITVDSLTMPIPLNRLVRLRGPHSKDQIPFEPTEETLHWRDLLVSYNAFILKQNIALAITPEEDAEWIKRLNRQSHKGSPSITHPERFRTQLYRQFNNGSFEEGGRMYGGWWINTPKHLRSKITINGGSTTELDFSGCAIRMLYHERGLDYEDDPYLLAPVASYEEEAGLNAGYYREAIKAMTQALINGRSDGNPERIQFDDGFSFKPRFTRPEIRQMIEEKHAAIADALGTGAGLRLQRKDSDLALAIVTRMRRLGFTVLPIHDSFITLEANRNELSEMMKFTYRLFYDYNPIIKEI